MAKKKKGKKNGFLGSIGVVFSALGGFGLKLIPFALILAAFLFGAFGVRKILLADTHLKVREIRVVPPDVLTLANIKSLEDRVIGKNIVGIDLKKIASSIELGPGAKSVRVVREFPSTIRIEIARRIPAANILFRPSGLYGIVSEDGMIIATSGTLDPAWVLMEDFSEPVKEPRIGIRIQNKGYLEALKFMKAFEKQELSRKEKITRITLDPYGNVTVRLGAGPDFQLGRKPTEKFDMLNKAMYLFKNESRDSIEYMDLQFDRIAVKRK